MEAGPTGRIMTHELPRNDAYNGGPVVPADQCDKDYYREASVQERKDRLSAKYGHLRAAAARRAEESPRIAEANRRPKERPPELTAVALMGVDGGRRCRLRPVPGWYKCQPFILLRIAFAKDRLNSLSDGAMVANSVLANLRITRVDCG
jgi:hypothetical protein